MAQGIVTYDQAPASRGRTLESLVAPNRAAVFSTHFLGSTDKDQFTEAGSTTPAANANAVSRTGVITIAPGASKDVNTYPTQLAGTLSDSYGFVEVKIKTADADSANSAFFVGFAEDVTAAKILNTSGVIPAPIAGDDKIGIYKNKSDASLVFHISEDAVEHANEVDSGIDVADDTYVRLGVEVSGDSVKFFINGDLKKTYTGLGYVSAATFIPVVTVFGSVTHTVDYFMAGFDG